MIMKLAAALIVGCAIAACATSETEDSIAHENEVHSAHIISIESNADFTTTLSQLLGGLKDGGYEIFAVIDHQAGAQSIGQDLRPTTVVIFGNPRAGTMLMSKDQRIGLRLPVKMLVSEDAGGKVHITYTDLEHLFAEFELSSMEGLLSVMQQSLAKLSVKAAAAPK